MLITDPIADMLTRIRNALTAKHEDVLVPASTVKKAIAEILLDEGYIKSYDIREDGVAKYIHIDLKYGPNKQRVITGLKRISKPGLRIYARKDQLPKVLNGLGIAQGADCLFAGADLGLAAADVGVRQFQLG